LTENGEEGKRERKKKKEKKEVQGSARRLTKSVEFMLAHSGVEVHARRIKAEALREA